MPPASRIISAERIQEEFGKTLLTTRAPLGLELLKDSGLLAQFAPELLEMVGVTQNAFHVYDVWTHTLIALGSLPADASLVLRLATLLHDIGKPRTRTVDDDGPRPLLRPSRCGRADGPRPDAAPQVLQRRDRRRHPTGRRAHADRRVPLPVDRLRRAPPDPRPRPLPRRTCSPSTPPTSPALSPEHQDISRAFELRARIDAIQSRQDIAALTSPLDGQEIMHLLGLPPGKRVGRIKDYLTGEVVEGRLAPDDKETAARLAQKFLGRAENSDPKGQKADVGANATWAGNTKRFIGWQTLGHSPSPVR